jgi:hypothetical protein
VTDGPEPKLVAERRFHTLTCFPGWASRWHRRADEIADLLTARAPPHRAAPVGSRPPSNVCGRPQIPSNPAVDRRREVRLTAQLVGTLFAHAEELGDINDSKELPARHSPQYRIHRRRGTYLPPGGHREGRGARCPDAQ